MDVLTNQQLRTVYAPSKAEQINIGTLQQDPSVIAYVDVEDMLSKHFAVLGSTGVGKSSGRLAAAERDSARAAELARVPARRA